MERSRQFLRLKCQGKTNLLEIKELTLENVKIQAISLVSSYIENAENYYEGLFVPSGMEITTEEQLADLKRGDIIHINMDDIDGHNQSGIPVLMNTMPVASMQIISLENCEMYSTDIQENNMSADESKKCVIIKQEHIRNYSLNLSELSKNVVDKLNDGANLNHSDKDVVLKELAKSIFSVNPAIKREKVKEIALNLTLIYKQLRDVDSSGNIKGEGFETVFHLLENKLSHLRRTNPTIDFTSPRQMIRNKTRVDFVFRDDELRRSQIMEDLNNITNVNTIERFLKETFKYQRCDVNSIVKSNIDDLNNAFDLIVSRWSVLKDERYFFFNLSLFGGSNTSIVDHVKENLYDITVELKQLYTPVSLSQPDAILVLLTEYFKEPLGCILRKSGQDEPEAKKPRKLYPYILMEADCFALKFGANEIWKTACFSYALCSLIGFYINFFIPFVPDCACTLQFIQQYVCKIPITENNIILSSKKKYGVTLVAVSNAESQLGTKIANSKEISKTNRRKRRRISSDEESDPNHE